MAIEKQEPTELQKLEWENKALRDALQYLVDTKKRKETIGQDSIYMQRKHFGWIKAEALLSGSQTTVEILEDYIFKNIAGEEFKFFLDEANNFCLNIRFKNELIACFNMNDIEMNGIVEWKNKAEAYRREQ